MSIETPNSRHQSTERTDIPTPTSDQIRSDVHPDLKTPATTAFIEEHADTNPNSKRRRTMLVGGVIGGMVLGGVGVGGFAYVDHIATQHEQEAPNNNGESILPTQVASAEPSVGTLQPSPSPSSIDKALENMSATPAPKPETDKGATGKPFEVAAGLTPEELMVSSERRDTEILNAGCNEETLQDRPKHTDLTIQEYSLKIAKEQAQIWVPALFGPNHPIDEGVAATIAANANLIELYIRTSGEFHQDYTASKFISSSANGAERTIVYEQTISNNSADVPKVVTLTPTKKQIVTATYRAVDNKEILVDISYASAE